MDMSGPAPPAMSEAATCSPAQDGTESLLAGILKAFQSETQFSLLIYRTQLFGPNDIGNVKKIQAGYTVQTLSSYTHQPAPPPPRLSTSRSLPTRHFKADFPKFLNFMLQFCPEVAEEAATRLQFATINIGPGKTFDAAQLSDAQKADLASAVKDGYAAIQERRDETREEREQLEGGRSLR